MLIYLKMCIIIGKKEVLEMAIKILSDSGCDLPKEIVRNTI